MNIMLEPSVAHGSIKAIASKSAAHRLLICAAFAKEDTLIRCDEINEDISATVRCLSALGATIVREAPYYRVTPIKDLIKGAMLDCGESGSTMRFLVPVVCLLGADASFLMSGRLPDRPLSPLREELERCGISFSPVGSNPLTCLGKVEENNFSIVGNVSSQFISGLLFAIAVSGKTGCLKIIGKLESAPYVDLTVNALRTFGVEVATIDDGYVITKNNGITSATEVYVEGDWSNAAFPLALGAIGKEPVTVTGLNVSSSQGDRKITDILSDFGADVKISENSVTVSPKALHGIDIDASQIPDLVPILATIASVASGRTVIRNAERLRIKESNRLYTVKTVLNTIGASVTETDDGLIIDGTDGLSGGCVSSFGDHRIAMSAAVASVACRSKVVIENAEAAAKSYPGFWNDISSLGLTLKEI